MSRFLNETVFLVIALILCAAAFSSAQVKQPGGFFTQRFTWGAGAIHSPAEDDIPASAGIVLAPRIFVTTGFTDFSVSVDPSAQLLYSLSDAQHVSDKLFLQLPAMLHLNLGHLSSKDFYSNYGVFAGGGWTFQFGQGQSASSFAVDAGIRFWLLGQSFTAMYQRLLSHKKIFSSDDFLSLHINLGKYLSQVKANNKVSNFMKPYRDKK